jgi:hypothetical protein
MFTEAARLHFQTCYDVGGGSRNVQGKLFGKGCWLSENHILTALHVWQGISDVYEWPVAIRHDGLYKCEIAFEQTDADLLVLKTVEKLKHADFPQPVQYPGISANQPFLGTTVGYLATLKIPNAADDTDDRTYFASASVSMFMEAGASKGVFFALAGGLIQQGFSGGPVFEASGDVIGVLVQSLRFPVDPTNPLLSIATIPIMSPVQPYRSEILRALTPAES